MEITYTKSGDYYLPDLAVPDSPKRPIGAYGQMRRHYLIKFHHAIYSAMKIKGTLLDHLAEIDEFCRREVRERVNAMAKAQGITEELKRKDQMKWTALMNNIQQTVREQVLREYVYTEEAIKY